MEKGKLALFVVVSTLLGGALVEGLRYLLFEGSVLYVKAFVYFAESAWGLPLLIAILVGMGIFNNWGNIQAAREKGRATKRPD